MLAVCRDGNALKRDALRNRGLVQLKGSGIRLRTQIAQAR